MKKKQEIVILDARKPTCNGITYSEEVFDKAIKIFQIKKKPLMGVLDIHRNIDPWAETYLSFVAFFCKRVIKKRKLNKGVYAVIVEPIDSQQGKMLKEMLEAKVEIEGSFGGVGEVDENGNVTNLELQIIIIRPKE